MHCWWNELYRCRGVGRKRVARGRTGTLYNGDWCSVATETTYTSLRENLASVLDQVVEQQETVIVRRRGARDVALLPASELAGLMETAHLLRSPKNARRLMAALRRAERSKTKAGSVAELRRELIGETGT
jgi:antitoxin YefM